VVSQSGDAVFDVALLWLVLVTTSSTALVGITQAAVLLPSVFATARVSDVRAASQLGSLMFLPFLGIYLAGEIGLISLGTNNLLIISAVLAALDLVLFRISTATFRREEILTKWK
jgi:hypothetical protein